MKKSLVFASQMFSTISVAAAVADFCRGYELEAGVWWLGAIIAFAVGVYVEVSISADQ